MGYTTPVLIDNFTSDTINGPGYGGVHPNWFLQIPYTSATLSSSQYQIGNGSLVIDTDISGFGEDVATVNANGGTPALSTPGAIATANQYGLAFKYGYFQFTVSFNPDGYSGTGAVPALWATLSGYSYGPTDPNGDHSEIDFFEGWPATMTSWSNPFEGPVGTTPNPSVGDSGIIEWGSNGIAAGVGGYNYPPQDFSIPNTYGYLWTPSGLQIYLNNVLMDTIPISASDGGASQINFLPVILGTGYNWPLTIYSVQVWQ